MIYEGITHTVVRPATKQGLRKAKTFIKKKWPKCHILMLDEEDFAIFKCKDTFTYSLNNDVADRSYVVMLRNDEDIELTVGKYVRFKDSLISLLSKH